MPRRRGPPLSPGSKPRRLAGSFLPVEEEDPDFELTSSRERDDDESDDPFADDAGNVGIDGAEALAPWSVRSTQQKRLWDDVEYADRVLSRRRATLEAKRREAGVEAPEAEETRAALGPMDAGRRRRIASLRLMRANEQEWMRQRLAVGADARSRLNNDERKREVQRRRSEGAKLRYAKRKAAKEGGASGASRGDSPGEGEEGGEAPLGAVAAGADGEPASSTPKAAGAAGAPNRTGRGRGGRGRGRGATAGSKRRGRGRGRGAKPSRA